MSFSSARAIGYGEWTVNPQINYQAKLLNASSAPVSDGTYSIKLSLYTASSGGTPVWTAKGTTATPTALSVSVVGGLFTVQLGDTSAAGGSQNGFDENINWNSSSLYLGITVGSDAEMTPRKRLTSVPQAFNAQMLQGMSASGTAYGGGSVFVVNQTSETYASSTRSALKIISSGLNNQSDFLIDTINSSSSNPFRVSRTGMVTLNGISAVASSSDPIITANNTGESVLGRTWGIATNRLLVGSSLNATGTEHYRMVLNYVADGGLCLDNTVTPETCPSPGAGESLVADGIINTTPFDLAERYDVTGEAEPGDVLVVDPSNRLHVMRSTGRIYDPSLIGIVSTEPGFLLGRDGDASMALAGRVPTKVSMQNGSIAIGDPLTSSGYPGRAMKATRPGMIVGYALEAASATGTIEVFVQPGYHAGSFLQTDGVSTLASDDLVMNARDQATVAMTTVDSWGLTFRGSAWDGSQTLNQDLTLFQDVLTSTSSALSLKSGTSTVWSVDQRGTVRMAGDLMVGGKIFPAARSGMQTDKYLFLDDSMGATSTYIATNADGWQANDSYDFAERYYSPDVLQPGDLVVMSSRGKLHVQRSLDEKQMLLGIVSTKPAFVAGAPGPSTYPIALAGRVPTKVSIAKGKIAIGDLLAPSTMPGVAVKATQMGPVVGQALEAFEGSDVGLIEVFVNPMWWTGPEKPKVDLGTPVSQGQTTVQKDGTSYRGLARILAGGQRVHVTFPAIGSYPLVQVTPQGNVGDGWWTDNYTQDGFDIVLKSPMIQPVTFSWRAEPTEMKDNYMFLSNGKSAPFDRMTGHVPDRFQTADQENIHSGSLTPTPPAPTSTPTLPIENAENDEEDTSPPAEESEEESSTDEQSTDESSGTAAEEEAIQPVKETPSEQSSLENAPAIDVPTSDSGSTSGSSVSEGSGTGSSEASSSGESAPVSVSE